MSYLAAIGKSTVGNDLLLLADLDYVVREEVDDGFSGCSSRLALRVQNVKRVLILFV